MFTSGYELMTAITNVLIFMVSIVCVFSREKMDKLWKYFFICILFDSLLGSIIHGIVMSESIKMVLWISLSLLFSITINILLTIFLKVINKKIKDSLVVILSLIIYLIIVIEFILEIDFLNTYIIYACLSILIVFGICIREYFKNKKFSYECFIAAIIFQMIGGIFLINKSFSYDLLNLDKNGIYHLFLVASLIFFYKGSTSK